VDGTVLLERVETLDDKPRSLDPEYADPRHADRVRATRTPETEGAALGLSAVAAGMRPKPPTLPRRQFVHPVDDPEVVFCFDSFQSLQRGDIEFNLLLIG
jgi:hypothetical protein